MRCRLWVGLVVLQANTCHVIGLPSLLILPSCIIVYQRDASSFGSPFTVSTDCSTYADVEASTGLIRLRTYSRSTRVCWTLYLVSRAFAFCLEWQEHTRGMCKAYNSRARCQRRVVGYRILVLDFDPLQELILY